MKIAQDVNHIADAKLRSFIDLSNATGMQQGFIKVNHNTYKITVGKDGVDVQFQGGIFNSWRQRSLDRLRAAMQEQYDKFQADYQAAAARPDYYEDFEGQFSPAVKWSRDASDAALDKRFGEDAGGREVVMYGYHDLRTMVADKVEDHNAVPTSIDFYNQLCGIDPETLSFDNLPGILDGIRNNTLQPKVDPTVNIPRFRSLQWALFLHDHSGKVDIFAKIRNYKTAADNPKMFKHETGWVGEAARKGFDATMKALVRKNIPGDQLKVMGFHNLTDRDVTAIACFFQQLAARDGRATDDERKALMLESLGYAGYGEVTLDLRNALLEVAESVMRNMVFRQTSKLGLDFFRREKIPVMFQWSNHEGVSLANNKNSVQNTWWKDPGESIHNHYGATITHSEMRHVMKMQASPKGGKLDLLKVSGMKV